MTRLTAMKASTQRCAAAAAICIAAIGAWLGLEGRGALATPPSPAKSAAAPESPSNAPPSSAGTTRDPDHVQIVITTMPPASASVTWGNARLGRIGPREPLVVTRARDSGPLDVVVRAAGYLPVQTRAHTFEDTTLQVKLTRPSQRSTLVGYRQPIDAGAPLGADGGVPPLLSDVPLSQPAAPVTPPAPLQWPSANPNTTPATR
jgi:hypothetical protein